MGKLYTGNASVLLLVQFNSNRYKPRNSELIRPDRDFLQEKEEDLAFKGIDMTNKKF